MLFYKPANRFDWCHFDVRRNLIGETRLISVCTLGWESVVGRISGCVIRHAGGIESAIRFPFAGCDRVREGINSLATQRAVR